MQLGSTRYLIDVTIRDPCAPSKLSYSSKERLAAAARAERKKHDTYDSLAKRLKAKVIPFVVESHGGIGQEATKFISDLLSRAAAMSTVWQPSELVHSIFWSVACAVQKWNARIIRDALRTSDFDYFA